MEICVDISEIKPASYHCIVCIPSSGVAKGGPGRARAHPSVCCAIPLRLKKSRYSNREVKYSNKAVSRQSCALPTY